MDLRPISGLPMQLDDTGALHFDPGIVIEETRARSLDELTSVYLDQETCRGGDPAYWMYNGVAQKNDLARLSDLHVRYELTLMPEMVIGRERVKTHGHIHAPDPITGIDFPEICEVLVGTAHFLFQDLDLTGPSASTAFYVEVNAGEKIVIPPGYEHLTINPGPGPLLFSDVVARGMSGIYAHMRAARGAAYLEVVDGEKPRFVPNPGYTSVPPLQKALPRDFAGLDLSRDTPLYLSLRASQGQSWSFLWDPSCFQTFFPTLNHVFQFA